MKKSILFFSLLTLLASCTTTQEESPFVTVRNGKFYQGGKEYRYVGTNFWYGAILASEGQGGDRQRLHRELDKLHAPVETFFIRRDRGAGRPTKKERRDMESLYDSFFEGEDED